MKVFPTLSLLRLLCIGLLLSGCAHKAPRPLLSEDWQSHVKQLLPLQKWQLTGKLAVKVPNDGGSMSLLWQQQPNEFNLNFSGPFGQNLLSIQSQGKTVTLSEPDHAPITAGTAEELIRRNTGWHIPVSQLAYWVRGLPDPTARVRTFETNSQGLPAQIEQLDWKITYNEYMSVTTSTGIVTMPKRIIAEYKDIRLTMAIREWQMEPVL